MSAGLACHGTVGKTLAKVGEEVSGNDVDVLCLACALNCCDRALERISAAACRNQSVKCGICVHKSFCCLGAALRGSACILGFGKLYRIIGMCCVPLFYARLITFPAAKPCGVALLPADQADVAVALVDQDLNQFLAVLGLILVNRADVILGIGSGLVDVSAGLLVDDTEELCEIDLVVIAGLDCGSHLGIGRVADDDALASCCTQLLYGSCNLLGYVALVNILNLNAESLSRLVDDQFALRTQNVCGAPDGNADLDLTVCRSLCCRLFRRALCGSRRRSAGASAAAYQCGARQYCGKS